MWPRSNVEIQSATSPFKTAALACCALAFLQLTLCNKAQAQAHCPRQTTRTLVVGNSTVCLVLDSAAPAKQKALQQAWVERSAHIVAGYYGQFPAPQVLVQLRSGDGAGINGGRTTNDDGLMIQATVGRDTTAEAFNADWVMVHEMVHLALPEIGRSHNWLAEGLAVYVEGVARAQAGNRAVSDVWAEDRREMPRGLPRSGEGGMDQTHTWARTYWGGALFCLQAEMAIREQTHNRMGLQTALRAILKDTGGYGFERDIVEVLRVGDAATGTHVLYDLYSRSRDSAQAPDLDAIWTLLGVPENPAADAFDDHAPLAAVRTAITAAP
jgi:hypothetical protein